MKERLIEFLAYLGIGQTKFEEKVGLSRGFVHRLKDNVTLKTLSKIESAYPELNTDWLKTGDGEMLKIDIQENNVKTNSGIVGIQGNGHNITNNDISAMKELISPIVALIEKKDVQVENIMNILNSKDEQINRLIGIIENYEIWKE